MHKLLIIKAGEQYLRLSGSEYSFCPLNKASVFPLGQVEDAKVHCRRLGVEGVAAVLMKLTIIEEPYGD